MPRHPSPLGLTFRDSVSGFQGVCTSRVEYLCSTPSLGLTPPSVDGKASEPVYIDERRCIEQTSIERIEPLPPGHG